MYRKQDILKKEAELVVKRFQFGTPVETGAVPVKPEISRMEFQD